MVKAEDVSNVLAAVDKMLGILDTPSMLSAKVPVRPTTTATETYSKSAAASGSTASPAVEERDEVVPHVVIKASPSTETAKSVLSISLAASKSSRKSAVVAAPVDGAARDGDDEVRDKEEPILAASPSTEDEIATTRSHKSVHSTKLDRSLVEAAPVDVAGEPTAHSVNDNDDAKSVVSTKSGRSIKSFFSSKSTKKSGGVQLPDFAGNDLTDDDANKSVASSKSDKSVASNKSTRSIKSIKSLLSFKSARSSKLVQSANDSAPVKTIETMTSVDSTKSAFSTKAAKSTKSDIAASPSTDTARKSNKSAIAKSGDSEAKLQEKRKVAASLPSLAEESPLEGKETVLVVKEMELVAPVGTTMEEKSCLPPTPIGTVLFKEEVSGESSVVAVGKAQEPPKEASFTETPKEGEVVETTPPLGAVDFTMSKSSSSEAFDDYSNLSEDDSMMVT